MPYISVYVCDFDDDQLIDELEERGYHVAKDEPELDDIIWSLYQAYITETDAGFRRTAAKVFLEHLGKTV